MLKTLTLATLLALAGGLAAEPPKTQSQADLDAQAAVTMKAKLVAPRRPAGPRPPAAPEQARPLGLAEAKALTRRTHEPVLVRVGEFDCSALCVGLRPALATAHCDELAGDDSPRLVLIVADWGGVIRQSTAVWRSLPTRQQVEQAAAEIRVWLATQPKPGAYATPALWTWTCEFGRA